MYLKRAANVLDIIARDVRYKQARETKSSTEGTHVIGESDPEEPPEAARSLSNTMPLPALRVRRRGCRGGVRGGVSPFICVVTDGRVE